MTIRLAADNTEGGGYRTQLSLLRALVAQADAVLKRVPDVDVCYFMRNSVDGDNIWQLAKRLEEATALMECGLQKMQQALREAEAVREDGDLHVPIESKVGSPEWKAGYDAGIGWDGSTPLISLIPPFPETDPVCRVSWLDGYSAGLQELGGHSGAG